MGILKLEGLKRPSFPPSPLLHDLISPSAGTEAGTSERPEISELQRVSDGRPLCAHVIQPSYFIGEDLRMPLVGETAHPLTYSSKVAELGHKNLDRGLRDFSSWRRAP